MSNNACVWSCVDHVHMPDTWSGSCGAVWGFVEGGPSENRMHFCPECGKRASAYPVQQTRLLEEPLSRSLIRGAFLRNGASIEESRDDLPDWVFEGAFDLLEAVGAKPVEMPEPVAWLVGTPGGAVVIETVYPSWAEDGDGGGYSFQPLYTAPQAAPQTSPAVSELVEALEGRQQPSDDEILSWASEEQFFLFCDEDDLLQIARAVLERFGGRIELRGTSQATADGLPERRGLADALNDAATSLETISRAAGREDHGLDTMTEVRGYANSRARAAREDLDAYRKQGGYV